MTFKPEKGVPAACLKSQVPSLFLLVILLACGGAAAAEDDSRRKLPRPKKPGSGTGTQPWMQNRGFGLAFGRGMPQANPSKKPGGKQKPRLAVPIPEKLPHGAVLKLKHAIKTTTLSSGNGCEVVKHAFIDVDTARKDFNEFAERAPLEKVTARQSDILSAREGAHKVLRGKRSVFFRLHIHVYEVRPIDGGQKFSDTLAACEKIVSAELERRGARFGTIRQAYGTFHKAVTENDTWMLGQCFPENFLARNKLFLSCYMNTLRNYLPSWKRNSRTKSMKIRFLRAETIDRKGWAIIVLTPSNTGNVALPPWLWGLQGTYPSYRNRKGRLSCWLPYVRRGGAWKLDLDEISRGFQTREAADNHVLAATFLRVVALAQEDIRSQNGGTFAGTFEEIAKTGLVKGTLADRKYLGYEFKFNGSVDGQSWSMTARPIAGSGNKELCLYIDMSGILRAGKGTVGPSFAEFVVKQDRPWAPPFQGIRIGTPTTGSGALVSEVIPGTAAQKYGVRAGDVILVGNGTKITSTDGLIQTIVKTGVGKKYKMEILRDGKKIKLTAILGRRPAEY